MHRLGLAAVIAVVMASASVGAWGVTGHRIVARVAVEKLPADMPDFLQRQIDWIGERSITPDTYRAASEPFIKMAEDPSHEWHLEEVAFLKTVPRSRVEFIQAIYDEYQRVKKNDPSRAALLNVRGTGLLPYTAIEVWERLKVTFRWYRELKTAGQRTSSAELDAAFYTGWLSHYIADGAQPLHTSIHHDGWIGDNPRGYTRNGDLHWGFENDFIELTRLSEKDIEGRIPAAAPVSDPFAAILEHLQRGHTRVERVYQLEQQHAFSDASSAGARTLAVECLTDAATLLRDLIYSAWTASAAPAAPRTGIVLPTDPKSPGYNEAVGSAPAPRP